MPDQWYWTMPPPAGLRAWLVCSWEAQPNGRTQLTPDGCSDLLATSTGAVILCGPEHRSWDFELPADTTAVGVRFRAGQLRALFDLDVSTITDRQVPLWSVVSDQDEADPAGILRLACDGNQELGARRAALLDWIAAWSAPRDPDQLSESILRHLLEHPTGSQERLAHHVGLSPRTLHRRAMQRFGYGTSTLARLIRFQRLLALALETQPGTPLAVLAAQAGYADHAHLVRDCRAISDQPPTAFLSRHFPTFPDLSDPYKTGQPFAATIGE